MAIYKVCDLFVKMSPIYKDLALRAKPFLAKSGRADMVISLEEEDIQAFAKDKGLSPSLAEYQLSCVEFCKQLLSFGGFVMHASAVLYDNGVYMFSAPSGIGKSTQAALWVKNLPGACIINDDKPAIRILGGVPYAYGTPWCGSGYGRLAKSGVIKALYFIRRNGVNYVKPMDKSKIPYLMLESMLRPLDNSDMDKLFTALDGFVSAVPIFSLDCNTNDDAVQTALSVTEGKL